MPKIYVPRPMDKWECPNCRNTHSLPVERDSCGAYIEPPTEHCSEDRCCVKLCPACPKFVCDGCGLAHCEDHRITLGGESMCPVCALKGFDSKVIQ